jgi:DNA-binding protein H-NS
MVAYNEEEVTAAGVVDTSDADWADADPALAGASGMVIEAAPLVQAAEEAQALNAPIEVTQAPILPASNADAPALAVGGDTPASVVQAEMGVIPATRSNLDDLSVEELDRQQREIQARIEAKRAGEKKAVLDQIVTVVTQYGLTVAEVVEALGGLKAKRKGSPAGIKYRDPSNPANTWSGRGKEPAWIRGKDRASFLITS